jgi:amino acid transporter
LIAAIARRSQDIFVNFWSVTAMGIGAMVGAGIFALLGVVALDAGNETYVSFLIGGAVTMLSGYAYAKLAARYPDGGGLVAYYERAFGVGTLSGTLSLTYLLTVAATVAMIAKAFGAYAAPLVHGATNGLWVNPFASGATILIVLLNVAGSSLVGKTEVVLVAIKLAVLSGLILAGSYGMTTHPPIEHPAPHFASLISSVALTFVAYAGFGMMANTAENVPHPRTTVPRAIYLAIVVVALLYAGLAIVVVGSVPIGDLSRDADTAVAVAARPLLGQAGYVAVSVAALVATASCINAWFFAGMQISLAMARIGHLPQIFALFVWRKGTLGILLSAAGVLLAINLLDLAALATIVGATFMLSHMAVQVACWRLADDLKASRLMIALGLLAMAVVMVFFLWSIALVQPRSLGLIVLFVAGSWLAEFILARVDAAGISSERPGLAASPNLNPE